MPPVVVGKRVIGRAKKIRGPTANEENPAPVGTSIWIRPLEKNMSSSDDFLVKPTREITNIFLSNWRYPGRLVAAIPFRRFRSGWSLQRNQKETTHVSGEFQTFPFGVAQNVFFKS